MSASVSSAPPTASVAVGSSSNVGRNPQPHPEKPTVNNTGYTVQVSEAQQVYQLYNQGQQISQIATALNLSVSAVNNYLGITDNSDGSGS